MKIPKEIKFDVLIVGSIIALSLIPVVRLTLISANNLEESLEYTSSRTLRAEYNKISAMINDLEESLMFYSCNYSDYSPEVASYLYYNDYLEQYNANWIANLTGQLETYRIDVESWQSDIYSSLTSFNQALEGINTQINTIESICVDTSRLISQVNGQLRSISKAISIGTARIRYRFSKKVAGVRVSFSISIPVSICDIIPEACRIQGSIDSAISNLIAINEELNMLSQITADLTDLANLPNPPSMPGFPPYEPVGYSPYNRTLNYDNIPLATSGVSYFTGNLDLGSVNLSWLGLVVSGLTLLSGLTTYLKYKVSRHHFYSVEEMIIKLERNKMSFFLMLLHSLSSVLIILLALTAISSLYEDTSCNTQSLYLTARLNLKLEEYNSNLLDSVNSCLVCNGTDTVCSPRPELVDISFRLSDCSSISYGFGNNLVIATSLIVLYLTITSVSGLVKDILSLRSLNVSNSPRKMSNSRKDSWLIKAKAILRGMFITAFSLRLFGLMLLLSPISPYWVFPLLATSKILEIAL